MPTAGSLLDSATTQGTVGADDYIQPTKALDRPRPLSTDRRRSSGTWKSNRIRQWVRGLSSHLSGTKKDPSDAHSSDTGETVFPHNAALAASVSANLAIDIPPVSFDTSRPSVQLDPRPSAAQSETEITASGMHRWRPSLSKSVRRPSTHRRPSTAASDQPRSSESSFSAPAPRWYAVPLTRQRPPTASSTASGLPFPRTDYAAAPAGAMDDPPSPRTVPATSPGNVDVVPPLKLTVDPAQTDAPTSPPSCTAVEGQMVADPGCGGGGVTDSPARPSRVAVPDQSPRFRLAEMVERLGIDWIEREASRGSLTSAERTTRV